MLVRRGEHTVLEARTKAEPAADVVTTDNYTRIPQIRLAADSIGQPVPPEASMEIILDGNDIARLVQCAIRHPAREMRYAVLTALWNHPDTFRELFRFGLEAPPGFPEIRQIVAEELGKSAPGRALPASPPVKPVDETLLPRMPLPAHLKGRGGR
jgi:hypothetical protein